MEATHDNAVVMLDCKSIMVVVIAVVRCLS
jgi:hypothetical protein